MKFVKLDINTNKETFLSTVKDNRVVNSGVRFGDDGAFPTAEVKDCGNFVHIRCRMVGGATKDNGFLFGTFFLGTVTEREGTSRMRGVIVSEPLAHLIWFALIVYYVIICFQIGGISLVPIFLSLLMYFMSKPEYKKQGVLKRYLIRAAKRAEENSKTKSEREV